MRAGIPAVAGVLGLLWAAVPAAGGPTAHCAQEISREIDRLSHPDLAEREAALRQLARIGAGDPEAVLSRLPDPAGDPDLLRYEARLRKLLDPRRLKALERTSDDPALAAAAEALFEDLGSAGHLALVDFVKEAGYILHDERFVAWDSRIDGGISLEEGDAPNERKAEGIRMSGETMWRWCRRGSLPNAGPAGEVVALFLDDADPRMRHTAVEGLERIGGAEVLKRAVPSLKDPDLNVRVGALRALSRNRIPEAMPEILSLLESRDRVSQVEAIYALGRYGEGAKRHALRLAPFLDREGTIPRFAAGALGKIVGLDLREDEASVEQARAWWRAHRADPDFN